MLDSYCRLQTEESKCMPLFTLDVRPVFTHVRTTVKAWPYPSISAGSRMRVHRGQPLWVRIQVLYLEVWGPEPCTRDADKMVSTPKARCVAGLSILTF
jgi:hypothetical protein